MSSACHVADGFDDSVVTSFGIVVGVDRIYFPQADELLEKLFLDGAIDGCATCSSSSLFVLVGVVILGMSGKLLGHVKLEKKIVGGID